MPRRICTTPTPFGLRNLAAAFLAGPWSLNSLVARGVQATGRPTGALRPLSRALLEALPEKPGPNDLEHFARVMRSHLFDDRFEICRIYILSSEMAPSSGPPTAWDVPALTTPVALADFFHLNPSELEWFADVHGRASAADHGRLSHYTYRWKTRRGGKARLLEMPKHHLKQIQRRLVRDVLDRIPPHDAAHAYRRGRSVVSNAAAHLGRRLVLRLDLRDFFPSIRAARVHALFRTAGYPWEVARLLTGLCTNVVPDPILQAAPWRDALRPALAAEDRFRVPHLPQGAPTSPALANLCAYRLDVRLIGLAQSVGATYTRYADDLVFSGDDAFARRAGRVRDAVCRIALDEGFEVHTGKTRFLRSEMRQKVTGVVVNAVPNVPRAEYDALKATLFNCVRHGPAAQNRDGLADFRDHLRGRVAFVTMVHPERGRKLKALFDAIAWS